MTRIFVSVLGLSCVLAACSADPAPQVGGGDDGNTDHSSDMASESTDCSIEPRFTCCGDASEFEYEPVCIADQWRCPAGTTQEDLPAVCEGPEDDLDMGTDASSQAPDTDASSEDAGPDALSEDAGPDASAEDADLDASAEDAGPDAATEDVAPVLSYSLTIQIIGSGAGDVDVTFDASSDVCIGPGSCQFVIPAGSSVTLSTRPAAGSSFCPWLDPPVCAGIDGDCVFTMTADTSALIQLKSDTGPGACLI